MTHCCSLTLIDSSRSQTHFKIFFVGTFHHEHLDCLCSSPPLTASHLYLDTSVWNDLHINNGRLWEKVNYIDSPGAHASSQHSIYIFCANHGFNSMNPDIYHPKYVKAPPPNIAILISWSTIICTNKLESRPLFICLMLKLYKIHKPCYYVSTLQSTN